MTNRTQILNELRESSPLLAAKDPSGNPYGVPHGYFEGLAGQVLSRLSSSKLPQGLSQPFTVPAGYFDQLADSVLNRVKALEAGSAAEELEVLSPLLSSLSKQTPYQLPEGYFEELPENSIDGAKAIELVNEELENLSPLMNNLRHKNPYTVPQGYFEALPGTLLAQVSTTTSARVVSMRFTRKVMRIAAAAVVTGLIVMAGWFYRNAPVNNTGNLAVTTDTSTQSLTSNITDEEIQQYLDQQGGNAADATAAVETVELKPENMKDMLADVSDDELQQFLEQTGNMNTEATN